MNKYDFYMYLKYKGFSNKVCSDNISRISRIEKSIMDCDIDDEYHKDKCESLMKLLERKREEELKKVLTGNLPIGSYTMSTYRYAVKKYVEFMNDLEKTMIKDD